jgi:hypothetical protein
VEGSSTWFCHMRCNFIWLCILLPGTTNCIYGAADVYNQHEASNDPKIRGRTMLQK